MRMEIEKNNAEQFMEELGIKIEDDKFDLSREVLGLLALKRRREATEMIVQEILNNNHIFSTKDDIKTEVWIYSDGIYKPNGKSFIKEYSRKILAEAYTSHLVNEIISKIEADTYIEQEDFFKDHCLDEIPVNNGILNIKTRDLSSFSPKKIFFNKIPVVYDPDKKCPNIDNFLKGILKQESDKQIVYELAGYSLYKKYLIQVGFMLVGRGRNGKGVLLNLLKRFVGGENCCSIPLSQMRPDSTALCELFGRMLNLAGDLSNTDLKETGMFKQITGMDLINAKRKFLRDLIFTNYAKQIFACNELPKVYDLSEGFWSRWVLLEFPYKFVPKEEYNSLNDNEKPKHKIQDPSILDKLISDNEMSGFLNEALDGLERLFENKKFSYTKGSREVKDFWVRKSDSFTAFCYDNLEEDLDGKITKKDLRKRYNQYCKQHKVRGAGDKQIKATLEDLFGAIENRVMMGDYERVWEGVKFKDQNDDINFENSGIKGATK